MKPSFKVTSSGKMDTRLAKFSKELGDKLEAGLKEAAEWIKQKSQTLVPKDTLALHDTARIAKQGSGLDCKVSIGYGGKDHPPRQEVSRKEMYRGKPKMVTRIPWKYTVYVHENRNVHHDEGQAKFLEDAVFRNLDTIRSIINSHL